MRIPLYNCLKKKVAPEVIICRVQLANGPRKATPEYSMVGLDVTRQGYCGEVVNNLIIATKVCI